MSPIKFARPILRLHRGFINLNEVAAVIRYAEIFDNTTLVYLKNGKSIDVGWSKMDTQRMEYVAQQFEDHQLFPLPAHLTTDLDDPPKTVKTTSRSEISQESEDNAEFHIRKKENFEW